ncbi:MAG: hypothetical protein WCJ54_04645, partial [Actinomycetota bacterium]
MKKFLIVAVTILLIVFFTFPTSGFGDIQATDSGGGSSESAPATLVPAETTVTSSPDSSTTTILADSTTTTITDNSTTTTFLADATTTSAATLESGEDTTTTSVLPEEQIIQKPVLKIEMILPGTTAEAGNNFKYKLKVENTGNSDATAIVIQTHVPENLNFISSTNGGIFDQNIANVNWNIEKLSAGEKFEAEVEIGIPLIIASGENKTITAMVKCNELELGSIAANFSINNQSALVSDALSLSVKAGSDKIAAGENLNYEITVVNTSDVKYTEVKIESSIPSGTEFISASDSGILDAGKVVWNLGSLEARESKVLNFTVKIFEDAVSGAIISSETTLDSKETDLKTSTIQTVVSNDLATILNGLLVMTVSADNSSPKVGENVKYIINIKNNGNVKATNLEIKDTIPEGLIFLSASDSGLNENGIVKWNIEGLEAGAEKNLEVVAQIPSGEESGKTYTGSVSMISSQSDPVVQTIDIKTSLDLITYAIALSITDNPDPVGAGQSVTYTIRYKSVTGTNLTGVVITDTIPEGTIFVSASSGSIIEGNVVKWNIGNLAANGEGAVTLVVNIPLTSTEGSIYQTTASINSDQTETVSTTEDTTDPVPYGSQLFYVFGYAPDVLNLLSKTNTDCEAYTAVKDDGIHSILSISNSASGSVVTAYLQNYADTTAFNPMNPTANTKVRVITINPGEVYTIDNLISSAYTPSSSGTWGTGANDWKVAGGDMLYITGGPVNV